MDEFAEATRSIIRTINFFLCPYVVRDIATLTFSMDVSTISSEGINIILNLTSMQ